MVQVTDSEFYRSTCSLFMARALITDPKLLLVDEPTVGLDPQMTSVIYDHLRRLTVEEGRTILMVDQNIMMAPKPRRPITRDL